MQVGHRPQEVVGGGGHMALALRRWSHVTGTAARRHVAAAAATVDHQTHKNRRLVTRVTPKHGATYSRVIVSRHMSQSLSHVTVTVCDPDLGPVNYWPLSLRNTSMIFFKFLF